MLKVAWRKTSWAMFPSVPLGLKNRTIDEKYGDDDGEKTRNA